MVKEKKVLDQEVKLFGEWRESIEMILKEKGKKKEDLEHQIYLLELQTNKLRDDNSKQEKVFEQWKKQELQKFENEKSGVMAELYKKQHDVDFGLMEHRKRMEDLEKREVAVKNIEDIKHKLSLDRIQIENLTLQGRRMLKDAQEKAENADSRMAKSVEIEQKNNEEFNRLNSLRDKFNIEQSEYEKNRKTLDDERKNLEEIRTSVQPKIEEFKISEDKIIKIREEIDQKTKELNEKIIEEKGLFEKLSEEKRRIDEKKKELNQREDELKRKQLLAEIKE